MNYLAVKDLKKPLAVRETLSRERQVVLTKDGRPFAIMVDIEPDAVEDALREIRRAMFSSAVGRARQRARKAPPDPEVINREVNRIRKAYQ